VDPRNSQKKKRLYGEGSLCSTLKVDEDCGRVASGGALAPEPPHAIGVGPESPRIVGRSNPYFRLFFQSGRLISPIPNRTKCQIKDVRFQRTSETSDLARLDVLETSDLVKLDVSDVRFEIGCLRRPISEKQKKNRKNLPVTTLPTGQKRSGTVSWVLRD